MWTYVSMVRVGKISSSDAPLIIASLDLFQWSSFDKLEN